MWRRAINVAVVLSLALCVVLLGAWLVARQRMIVRQFTWFGQRWELRAVDNWIEVTNAPQVVSDTRAYQAALAEYLPSAPRNEFRVSDIPYSPDAREEVERRAAERRSGFRAQSLKLRLLPKAYNASFPMLVMASVLPAVGWAVVARLRARKLARLGHCPGCGYDLRFSHYRCPECGKSVSKWSD